MQNVVIVFLAAALLTPAALADQNGAGWTVGLGCPAKGVAGSGALVSSRSGGFSGSGRCQRTAALFSKLSLTTVTGGTVWSSTLYGLQTPTVFISPPILNTEYQPVFTVAASCPIASGTVDLNWLFVQWTETERRALENTYVLGSATYSKAQGIVVTGQYDVSGSVYFAGVRPMGGTCTNGVHAVTAGGAADLDGTVYFSATGMGVFKTTGGRATFFLPRYNVTAATDFGSRSFRALTFDSASSDGISDVRQMSGTANAGGTTITMDALSDPETGAVDGTASGFTDTIVFTAVNAPFDGMLRATVTRTGAGAGVTSVACIAHADRGDVTVSCSGASPTDATLPYNVTLYAEKVHNVGSGLNAGVKALAFDGSTGQYYAGGAFTSYSAADAGGIARFNNDGSWDSVFSKNGGSGFNGTVSSLSLGASGEIYVGGSFTSYNGVSARGIARLNADGTLDTTFSTGTGFNSNVESIVYNAGTNRLYAAGGFTTFNGTGRVRCARLLTTGALDTAFAVGTGFDGTVTSIAFDQTNGRLVAVGAFNNFNSGSSPRIAALLVSGAVDTTFPVGAGFDFFPQSVAVDPASGQVYVAGGFTTYQGQAAPRVARLSAAGSLDVAYSAANGTGFDNSVISIAFDSVAGTLYAAGDFIGFNGSSRSGIARLTSTGALDTAFAVGSAIPPWLGGESIAVDGANARVYFGSEANVYDGSAVERAFRLETDGTIAAGTASATGLDNWSYAIESDSSDRVYVGGRFRHFGGAAAPGILRLNGDGTADTTFAPTSGVDASLFGVVAMKWDSGVGKLYVAGDFTTFNGVSRNSLARVDTDGSLDTTFAVGAGFDSSVTGLAIGAGSKLYVTGSFSSYAGAGVGRLARLETNGTLDTTFATGSGLNSYANALAYDATNTVLYVGGGFTSYNSTSVPYIARIFSNGTVDTAFAAANGAGFDSPVESIAVDENGKIYAAGSFSSFAGASRSGIARLNANGTLDTTFAVGSGFAGFTAGLRYDAANGKLYVYGGMAAYNGTPCGGAVRLNANGTLDPTFASPPPVNALLFQPTTGSLYLGLLAPSYGASVVDYLARVSYTGALE